MKYLQILNQKIPLTMLTGFSYTKTANLVDTQKLKVINKGYSCLSVSISLSLNTYSLPYYISANNLQSDYSFSDLVNHFLDLAPSIDQKPTPIILADNIICPTLLFSLVSISQDLKADRNGNVQECEVTLSLAGTQCVKRESVDNQVSYDETVPEATLFVNGKSLAIKQSCNILEFILTPSTLHLQIALSDSFKRKKSNSWVIDPTVDSDAYIEIENHGAYYIRSAQMDDNFVTYDCTVFPKKSEQDISHTVLEGTLGNVLDVLNLDVKASNVVKNIPIKYYRMNGNSQQLLSQIRDNLGLLVLFDVDSKVRLIEVPKTIPQDLPMFNFFVDEDIISAPTTKAIFRTPEREYSTGTSEGDCILVESDINCTEDRSTSILRLHQFMERSITLDIPYFDGLRQGSYVNLQYNNMTIQAMVTDFSADVLNNSMRVSFSYLNR